MLLNFLLMLQVLFEEIRSFSGDYVDTVDNLILKVMRSPEKAKKYLDQISNLLEEQEISEQLSHLSSTISQHENNHTLEHQIAVLFSAVDPENHQKKLLLAKLFTLYVSNLIPNEIWNNSVQNLLKNFPECNETLLQIQSIIDNEPFLLLNVIKNGKNAFFSCNLVADITYTFPTNIMFFVVLSFLLEYGPYVKGIFQKKSDVSDEENKQNYKQLNEKYQKEIQNFENIKKDLNTTNIQNYSDYLIYKLLNMTLLYSFSLISEEIYENYLQQINDDLYSFFIDYIKGKMKPSDLHPFAIRKHTKFILPEKMTIVFNHLVIDYITNISNEGKYQRINQIVSLTRFTPKKPFNDFWEVFYEYDSLSFSSYRYYKSIVKYLKNKSQNENSKYFNEAISLLLGNTVNILSFLKNEKNILLIANKYKELSNKYTMQMFSILDYQLKSTETKDPTFRYLYTYLIDTRRYLRYLYLNTYTFSLNALNSKLSNEFENNIVIINDILSPLNHVFEYFKIAHDVKKLMDFFLDPPKQPQFMVNCQALLIVYFIALLSMANNMSKEDKEIDFVHLLEKNPPYYELKGFFSCFDILISHISKFIFQAKHLNEKPHGSPCFAFDQKGLTTFLSKRNDDIIFSYKLENGVITINPFINPFV